LGVVRFIVYKPILQIIAANYCFSGNNIMTKLKQILKYEYHGKEWERMNPIRYDKISCRYMFNRHGNWLRIICKILGHKMVCAYEEMPLYHARCAVCKYEIVAE